MEFYLYGERAGDFTVGPTDDGSSGEINLSKNFSFFSGQYTSLFVSNYIVFIQNEASLISYSYNSSKRLLCFFFFLSRQ